MEDMICKICGSHYLKKINESEYQCECCGTTKALDKTHEEEVLLINAYKLLNDNNFIDSEEAFIDIYNKYPNCYDALWGKLLAHYGIVIIYKDGKGYPTLHDYINNSFLEDEIYKKFIDNIGENKKEVYLNLALEIDKILKKSYNELKKQEPYDIFISFKQSEENNENIKTKDYYEALKLHSFLVGKGYKVFFSPVSLQGEVGKEYEPRIFHALRTSEVLIVYGQSAEHFEATWVKNEWGRYISMMEDNLKEKDSLIVCIENMNAYDLPLRLKKLQAIDFSNNKNAYGNVEDIVNTIFSKQKNKKNKSFISEINIEKKQIKKKEKVEKKQVDYYEFQNNNITLTEDENIALEIADEKLLKESFSIAKEKYKVVLKINNDNAYAKMGILLSDNKIKSKELLFNNVDLVIKNYNNIIDLIKKFTKEEAEKNVLSYLNDLILNLIKDNSNKEKVLMLYKGISKFPFSTKNYLNGKVLNYSVECANFDLFNICINLVDENDVNKHIKYRILMQDSLIKNQDYKDALILIDETLNIEEGNDSSLYNSLLCYLHSKHNYIDEHAYEILNEVISYSSQPNYYLEKFFNVVKNYNYKNKDLVYDYILERIQKDIELRNKLILEMAEDFLNNNSYTKAEKFYNYYLSETKRKEEVAYEGLLLCKFKCKKLDDLLVQSKDFTKSKEFRLLQQYAKKNSNIQKYNDCNNIEEKYEQIVNDKKEHNREIIKSGVKKLLIYIGVIACLCFVFFTVMYCLDENSGTWELETTEEGKPIVAKRTLFGRVFETRELPELSSSEYKEEIITKPTCTEKGIIRYHYYIGKQDMYIDKEVYSSGHNFSSWELVETPTLTENGKIKRTCLDDEYVEEKIIPNFTSDVYEKEILEVATCIKQGKNKYTYYIDNGTFTFDYTTPIDHNNHKYGKCEIIKSPTLTSTGLIKRTCLDDDYVETLSLPVLSTYDYKKSVVTKATCSSTGKDRYIYSLDNENIYFEVVTEMASHHFEGFNCTNCNYVDSKYHITDVNSLYSALSSSVAGRVYILDNDIDCQGFKWSIIPNFNGILDGNNKTISNWSYEQNAVANYAMFNTNSGEIKNLNLSNCVITSPNKPDGHGTVVAGIICATNNGSIHNVTVNKCSVSIQVGRWDNNHDNYAYVGIICGINNNTLTDISITSSYLYAYASTEYSGSKVEAGMLTGESNGGIISNIISKNNKLEGKVSANYQSFISCLKHGRPHGFVGTVIGLAKNSNISGYIQNDNNTINFSVERGCSCSDGIDKYIGGYIGKNENCNINLN